MIFNSIEFLIFFPLVCIFYFLIPNKYKWIFFRANTISDAIYIIKNLFVNVGEILNPVYIISTLFSMGLNNVDTPVIVILVIILFIVSYIQRKHSITELIASKKPIIRYGVYYAIIMYMIFFSYVGTSQFIYFQF